MDPGFGQRFEVWPKKALCGGGNIDHDSLLVILDGLAPPEGGFAAAPRRQPVNLSPHESVEEVSSAAGKLKGLKSKSLWLKRQLYMASLQLRRQIGIGGEIDAVVDAWNAVFLLLRRVVQASLQYELATFIFFEFENGRRSDAIPQS
jgi:hypothetical protein